MQTASYKATATQFNAFSTQKRSEILWLNSNSLAAISHSDVEDTRLAAVIQRIDDAILWTNLYPADGGMRIVIHIRIDPLDSVILPLNN